MKTLLPFLLFGLLVFQSFQINAQQKFYSNSGTIHFLSKALLENIEAITDEVICIVDLSTGELAFKVPIKKFEFDKSLMKEHFNENYMESDKFPYATFSGSFLDLPTIDVSQNGKYNVQVKGDLTIHGVTQNITEKGSIEIKDGNVILLSEFIVYLKDYKVKIPKVLFQNIAEKLTVELNAELPPHAK